MIIEIINVIKETIILLIITSILMLYINAYVKKKSIIKHIILFIKYFFLFIFVFVIIITNKFKITIKIVYMIKICINLVLSIKLLNIKILIAVPRIVLYPELNRFKNLLNQLE